MNKLMRVADYMAGVISGVILLTAVFAFFSDEIAAEAVKEYKGGVIDCQTVGGEFICRRTGKELSK